MRQPKSSHKNANSDSRQTKSVQSKKVAIYYPVEFAFYQIQLIIYNKNSPFKIKRLSCTKIIRFCLARSLYHKYILFAIKINVISTKFKHNHHFSAKKRRVLIHSFLCQIYKIWTIMLLQQLSFERSEL